MMKIPLTVELDEDEAAAIARVKHTDIGNTDEIRDYLEGWLEHAIEAAEQDRPADEDKPGSEDPSVTAVPSATELAVVKLLVDTAFGAGGLADQYVLTTGRREQTDVLLLAERTANGLVALAELSPAQQGYETEDTASRQDPEDRPSDDPHAVVVLLEDRWELRSGVYDPNDPEARRCGEWVSLHDPSGREKRYWDEAEWRDEPSEVMGAIIAAAAGHRTILADPDSGAPTTSAAGDLPHAEIRGQRRLVVVEFLSDTPFTGEEEITDLAPRAIEDDLSMLVLSDRISDVDGPTLAARAIAQGSDPEFFGLDENGTPLDDCEDSPDEP
jgi:hypothetical protein